MYRCIAKPTCRLHDALSRQPHAVIKNHYDVIFIGSNLATRVAMFLLAKAGLRVMAFTAAHSPPPQRIPASLFVERILEQLAERTLAHQAFHLHLVNQDTRLECNGPLSIQEECRREFPTCHAEVVDLLDTLRQWGGALEQAVLTNGGLPLYGFGNRLQFRKHLLKKKVPGKIIQQPLSALLSTIDNAVAQRALASLLCGLSLAPDPERLTVAEAAICWNDLCRNKTVSGPALCTQLEQRFEQFHGASNELSAIKSIKQQNDSDLVVNLKGNRSCTADHYIIADRQALEYLPWQSEYPEPRNISHSASCFTPPPPALLAPTLIIGDSPIVRLRFENDARRCTIESPASEGDASVKSLAQRVAQILPFSRYELDGAIPATPMDSEQTVPGVSFPGTEARIKPRRSVFLCNGRLTVPHLDATGEVLTGLSLANHLTAGNSR